MNETFLSLWPLWFLISGGTGAYLHIVEIPINNAWCAARGMKPGETLASITWRLGLTTLAVLASGMVGMACAIGLITKWLS